MTSLEIKIVSPSNLEADFFKNSLNQKVTALSPELSDTSVHPLQNLPSVFTGKETDREKEA